jgi:hypothetical protein
LHLQRYKKESFKFCHVNMERQQNFVFLLRNSAQKKCFNVLKMSLVFFYQLSRLFHMLYGNWRYHKFTIFLVKVFLRNLYKSFLPDSVCLEYPNLDKIAKSSNGSRGNYKWPKGDIAFNDKNNPVLSTFLLICFPFLWPCRNKSSWHNIFFVIDLSDHAHI